MKDYDRMISVLTMVTFKTIDGKRPVSTIDGNVRGNVMGTVEGSVRGTGGCHVMGSIGKLLFMPVNNLGT